MVARRELLKWSPGLAFALSVSARAAPDRPPDYRYIDLTPELSRILKGGLSGNATVAEYRRRIVQPHRRMFGLIDAIDDGQLAEYLTEQARATPDRARLSETFPPFFLDLWNRFSAELPLSASGTHVYLLPAPEDFLGGSVRFDGRHDLVLLGSEVMGYLGEAGVAGAAFIHHELTHLYHQQQNEEIRDAARAYFAREQGARLYQILWLEGLAVYISGRLNPAATEFDLLRSREIRSQVASVWTAFKGLLRAEFDSTSHDTIARLVFDGDEAMRLPAKAGYYIGYRLAKLLGAEQSMTDLVRMGGSRLRTALLTALDSLQLRDIDQPD